MRRKRLLTSVTALAIAASMAPAAALTVQTTQASAFTKTALSFYVSVPSEAPEGAGTQICLVVGDLYRPASASPDNPVPAVLTTNGWGGSKQDQASIAAVLATDGYGVLSYSGLGFGGSGCKISLDDPSYDGRAGSQLISYLGHLPWIKHDGPDDPRVGMIGGSYGGGIQFAIAKLDRRLDTIIPFITWNDLRYSLAPNNATQPGETGDVAGDPDNPGTLKAEWTLGLFAVGLGDGITGARTDPSRDGACVDYLIDVCPFAAGTTANAVVTHNLMRFLGHASVGTYADRIRIPTLLIQGEGDTLFNLREAAATYGQLRAEGTPVKMIWQSWGHSQSTPQPGEWSQGADLADTYEGQRVLAWFAHYLKGEDVATGPAFAYYRDYVPFAGAGPDTVQYATAPAYPVGHMRTFYASAGRALVDARSEVTSGVAEYANFAGSTPLSYSEVSAFQGFILRSATQPFDTPGAFVGWTSAPLAHDMDVVGVPAVTLHVQTPGSRDASAANSLQMFVKVYDIAPTGERTLVHRLVAPVRVRDQSRAVHVLLPGIVHRFPAGDRIRLVVAATDTAYRNANLVQPAVVSWSKAEPVRLQLPVVAGT